jgi:hypothetical protein
MLDGQSTLSPFWFERSSGKEISARWFGSPFTYPVSTNFRSSSLLHRRSKPVHRKAYQACNSDQDNAEGTFAPHASTLRQDVVPV